jgi:predicted CoA-substrate-specific enzyme activase
MTGSAGLGLAQRLNVPFVQEVVAETVAVQQSDPQADVIIELGGEDAKITYLKPVPEQRMNGTCAGGTGAFIDQMATLLQTDAAGLDRLAADATTLYPIASRCGVFAKTDLQPLLNDGAPHPDLAASIFQAVATQTVAGLACGRPIRGRIILLGGPMHFLPQLRAAFARLLEPAGCDLVTPEDGQLMVALGAAQLADQTSSTTTAISLQALIDRLRQSISADADTPRTGMPALFADSAQRRAFDQRHAQTVELLPLEQASGACFLGIDAGSTTIKAVLIDDQKRILYQHYAPNAGDPVRAAVQIVQEIRQSLPGRAVIAHSCVTGYGEGLIKAALRIDQAEVETIAHYRAAAHYQPKVTSVIDIGGQDMKYLKIVDGVIDSISVNEACSSGCGSFLQTFAKAMGLDITAFAEAAAAAFTPVDLGSRCTVFMNSSVKQAQKEGATVGDISAGLSYAVIRNALYKVIKLHDANDLGEHVVVQGGTFLNDAVLRAFELLTEREVIRPSIAGLMGAFGAALIAQERFVPGRASTLLSPIALKQLTVTTTTEQCPHCQNHCQCTISTFPDGTRHVTGNRCERGAGLSKASNAPANLFEYKYKRLFAYRRLTDKAAWRGDIGIPRALNLYENYPLWFTMLTKLGFRVMLSPRSNHDLFTAGMDSIASENICYPAKLVHGHIEALLDRGITTIWFPSVAYEDKLVDGSDNCYNCPVVAAYPQVIQNNLSRLREGGEPAKFLNPFLSLNNPAKLVDLIVETFTEFNVSYNEAQIAVEAGLAEQEAFRRDMAKAGEDVLAELACTGGSGVVLAGRPYHVDPEIHHGIPELISSLGLAVLTEDSIAHLGKVVRPLRSRDQWSYHSRLYAAAAAVAEHTELELVQLNSFGCGLDAITTDQVAEILHAEGRVYTCLKIDEVSNLGAARIRLRSLIAATQNRQTKQSQAKELGYERVPFTKEHQQDTKHTIIAPQMSPIHFSLLTAAFRGSGYRVCLLEEVTQADVDRGLRHVNNDACYPAIMVVGQLVNAFASGSVDPNYCSVMITQTGGMCRATNYVGLLRKALAEAGFANVPVVAISTQGIEKNPGFKLTGLLLRRAIRSVTFGDLLQNMLLRTRPYEVEPGSALALYRRWDQIGCEWAQYRGKSATWGRHISFGHLCRAAVRAFDRLPLKNIPRKPRVGVVGEILVKFHPDANNHVVDIIEAEGHEVVLPGLMEFVVNGMYAADWNYETYGIGKYSRYIKRLARRWVERYRRPALRALGRSRRFTPPRSMPELVARAREVVSLGNQAGEGWLLTAEILELIDDGVKAIICAQPFACLPNHVTGKGVFRELRRRHPLVNLTTIEYDPGACEVNQLNRIKLLLAASPLSNAPSHQTTPHSTSGRS